jgi:hypothetical protein
MDAFYQTVTTFCFTLIGLWWGVVQFRHDEWMHDPNHRRMAYAIHLSFLIPGVMSLGSLVSQETRIIWQLAFVIAGALGGLGMFLILRMIQSPVARGWLFTWGKWIVLLLYALVVLIAILPDVTKPLNLKPLQVEGLLLSILVFLGVSFAWEFTAMPKAKKE